MDNIVIKSPRMADYMIDLQETLETLRRTGLKLNHAKRIFSMGLGKSLNHVISTRGLQANSKKMNASIKMRSSRSLKEGSIGPHSRPTRNTRDLHLLGGQQAVSLLVSLKQASKFKWTPASRLSKN